MVPASEPPWEELHASLRSFIGRRVRNQADVEDLVQRVLLQIVKGLGSLRDSERLHAWVYRTARNVLIDHYRASAGRREIATGAVDDLAAVERAPAGLRDLDEAAALQELAGCLTPMLRQLSPASREAISLADLQGVHQAEAAARAGISVSGMKSRVQRGRRQLKAVLEQCCRIDLDRRGTIVGYAPRSPGACACGEGD